MEARCLLYTVMNAFEYKKFNWNAVKFEMLR